MSLSGRIRLVFVLAVRNIVVHRRKSIVIGLVLFGNGLLLVLGLSLMASMDNAMVRNVTSTLAGHLQVYSGSAPEPLELFGNSEGLPDIGVVPDFEPVKMALESVPNVKLVVPMGTGYGMLALGNPLDRRLADLRSAVAAVDSKRIPDLLARTRETVKELGSEDVALAASADGDTSAWTRDLETAKGDALWRGFAARPFEVLEFLENKVAPLAGDPDSVGLLFVGTDVTSFGKAFERFEIVKGETVPEGERGLLLAEKVHERPLKNPAARSLDLLFEDVVRDRLPIGDQELEGRVRRMRDRRDSLLQGIGPDDRVSLEGGLRKALPEATGGLSELIDALLTVSRDNLEERRRIFYEIVAPHAPIYKVDIGDTVVVTSMSSRGYRTSTKVKVYGTFRFKGLEGFDSASYFNITDLVTYRALAAEPTAETQKEMEEIQAEVRRLQTGRDEFDDSLFDTGDLVERAGSDSERPTLLTPIARSPGSTATLVSSRDLAAGSFGHAAVILSDPSALEDKADEVRAALRRGNLDLRVVTWREAAGLIAQYFDLVRVQLFVALGIIFLVAVVIINMTIVIAVLERVRELGTLRALGAHKILVTASILCETALLGLVACGGGVFAGAAIVGRLNEYGVPALTWVWAFLFGGPRLYPEVTVFQVMIALVIATTIGVCAALYPAMLATRVPPIAALRRGD